MSGVLPIVCLARHGETTWSLSGQHTGLTDLPLTERGELNAQSLGRRLRGFTFTKVFTSPLKRAVRTCELAGFGGEAETDRDLLEWDYGQYEGRRTREIHQGRPGWQLFRDGCPGGETPDQVGARAAVEPVVTGAAAETVVAIPAHQKVDALVTGHPVAPRRGPQLLPELFNHDQDGCVRSLAALGLLDTDVLLPGHGPVWRGSIREASEKAAAQASS